MTAWSGAANMWKTDGLMELFVLMPCVNMPPRRPKMKLVLLFGLWPVA